MAENVLEMPVFHLRKLVDAGLITKAQAETLLQELVRIYRTKKPTFSGSPAQQTNQHLALIQQAVISLMTKTLLPHLPPAEQERIAKAVAEELGNPDYRTFDLARLIQKVRDTIIAQARKSKQPADEAPKVGKAPSQPASGAGPTPSGAGQGGRGSGGSGGGPPVAQGPNPRPDGEGNDEEGKKQRRKARLPPEGTPERRKIEAARDQGIREKKKLELANIKAGG